MTTTVDINGKKLLTIKAASEHVGYSRDYITRLARERKIVATQLGRFWYVDLASLKNFEDAAQSEQNIRKRQLSEERKRDLAIKEKRQTQRERSLKRAARKAPVAVAVAFVVFSGIGLGYFFESNGLDRFMNPEQVANLNTGALEPAEDETELIPLDSFVSESTELQPDFENKHSITSLKSENGILLFPGGTDGSFMPSELFSDPVEVTTASTGESVVIRLDENGEQIGDPIPYVIVPVNSNSP